MYTILYIYEIWHSQQQSMHGIGCEPEISSLDDEEAIDERHAARRSVTKSTMDQYKKDGEENSPSRSETSTRQIMPIRKGIPRTGLGCHDIVTVGNHRVPQIILPYGTISRTTVA